MPLIPALKIGIWNAWLFMSVFLLQMLIMALADRRVWERSHIPAHFRRNKFEKYISIIANLVWLSALGYSVFLPLKLGTIWFYAGLSVFVIGLTIMAMATSNFITTPVDVVITKGVYQISRHPMYLATFLICLGSGIASASSLFIIISVTMAFCFHREALLEERYCLEEYGGVYQQYLRSVPRWIGVPIPDKQ